MKKNIARKIRQERKIITLMLNDESLLGNEDAHAIFDFLSYVAKRCCCCSTLTFDSFISKSQFRLFFLPFVRANEIHSHSSSSFSSPNAAWLGPGQSQLRARVGVQVHNSIRTERGESWGGRGNRILCGHFGPRKTN